MNRTQKALIAAIVIGVALHFVGGADASVRNYEIMPEMHTSIPYGSQDANPNFADGMTARAPIPGTIARGFAPLTAKGVVLNTRLEWKELGSEQQKAWDALPAPKSDAAIAGVELARGREVLQAKCAVCHGPGAVGDGSVTKRGVPPPPPLFAAGAKAMSDGHLYRIITVGQGNMAPHASQVARADRWRVVRFIRSLQK
jgi:mono/diheme cytochrome c family protein